MLQYVCVIVAKGSVAQWLEQGTHKPKVVGSNPTRANFGEMAEWSKAADC